jgi:hypothetical protein
MARQPAKRKPVRQDVESDKSDESEESGKSKESVESSGTVVAPDGVSKYIVREYKDDMRGVNIPDKCVVRSENRRFFTAPEELGFWKKSTASCPTYGARYVCFGSGPVNMHCQECKQKDHIYKIWVVDDRFEIFRNNAFDCQGG